MERPERISLNEGWTLSHPARDIALEVSVPSTVFEALINNGIIEDPFRGSNENDMAWVYESDWTYTNHFEAGQAVLGRKKVTLRFHGLDTIADVCLNGEHLGFVDNMFMVHDFDVTGKIKEGTNDVKVEFKSPTRHARDLIKKHGFKLRQLMSLPGMPYLRKAQYSFGWDWGPKLPDTGIWQPVELVCQDFPKIEDVAVQQHFDYNLNPATIQDPRGLDRLKIESVDVIIDVKANLDAVECTGALSAQITLTAPSGEQYRKEASFTGTGTATSTRATIKVRNPMLWWTHDFGQQHLHVLSVNLLLNGKEIDSQSKKIGLREIVLMREPDKHGESFYFRLNGIPVFAKGANWIPVDTFIPRGKKLGVYESLLDDAVEANFNFMRVWGGGIYEDDAFYDACDERGIMVWQDFPFACAIYPYWKEFLDAVEVEAAQNIKRLRHHASLSLWCGNNEIEQLWPGISLLILWSKLWKRSAFKRGYIELFEQRLPRLVAALDPDRQYWPSSPSNGSMETTSGLFASNSPDRGDSHFWKVWHMNAPFSAYRKFDSRFMSEYGFESFPGMKTIEAFCPADQLDFYSPVMEGHQKNRGGNKKIMNYMERRFSIPPDFPRQVHVSQLTQAEAIAYGIEHWRRNRNEKHCMGSLYWQLNDCWPVASWSSIDYFLRWKALHYFVKRAYEPLFASILDTADAIELWLTNDHPVAKTVMVGWHIVQPSGNVLLERKKEVTIFPCSSIPVEKITGASIGIPDLNAAPVMVLYHVTGRSIGNRDLHGFRITGNPKNLDLVNPGLKIETAKIPRDGNGPTLQVRVSSEKPAVFVSIESSTVDFIASDNYFALRGGDAREIEIRTRTPPQVQGTKAIGGNDPEFTVTSLYEMRR